MQVHNGGSCGMSNLQTKRIDAGIKRGPKIKPAPLPKVVKTKPSDLLRDVRDQARNDLGKFAPIHTIEQRREAVANALHMLEAGLTTEDIGKRYGVTGAAIRTWLIAYPEADQARTLFFSRIQVDFADMIAAAPDPLSLARAREGFSAWHKIAKVRDPNFSDKQEVTVINADLGDRLRRARERTIEHEPATDAVLIPDDDKQA